MKQLIKSYRIWYGLALTFALSASILMTLFSIELGTILDSLSISTHELQRQVFLCVLTIMAWYLCSWTSSYFKNFYIKKIILDLKDRLVQSYLNQDFPERKSESEFLNSLTKNIDLLMENHLVAKFNMVVNLASMLISICALMLLEWRLALLFLLLSLLTINLSQIPGKLIKAATETYTSKNQSYLDIMTNFLKSFEQIKLLGIQKRMQEQVGNSTQDFENARQAYQYGRDLASNTGTFLSFFSQVACMVVGIIFVRNDLLTIGLLVASIQLLNGVFGPFQNFLYSKNLIQSADSILVNFDELIRPENQKNVIAESKQLAEAVSSISIQELRFEIDNRILFSDFSFEFQKGKTYAVVGESGVGKTTLMKLILNYYSSTKYQGKIEINGVANDQINSQSLYKEIAFVQKNDFLVKGSVLDNIELGNSAPLSNKLKEVMGFDSQFLQKSVGGDSSPVSEGEKQRIDLSRYLSQNYSVYIFDEPTSNLDPIRSRKIMDYILSISDAIIIVITHDQDREILKRFDQVIRIDGKRR